MQTDVVFYEQHKIVITERPTGFIDADVYNLRGGLYAYVSRPKLQPDSVDNVLAECWNVIDEKLLWGMIK
jgi:hypothetical protein